MPKRIYILTILMLLAVYVFPQSTPSYSDLIQVRNKRTDQDNLVWRVDAVKRVAAGASTGYWEKVNGHIRPIAIDSVEAKILNADTIWAFHDTTFVTHIDTSFEAEVNQYYYDAADGFTANYSNPNDWIFTLTGNPQNLIVGDFYEIEAACDDGGGVVYSYSGSGCIDQITGSSTVSFHDQDDRGACDRTFPTCFGEILSYRGIRFTHNDTTWTYTTVTDTTIKRVILVIDDNLIVTGDSVYMPNLQEEQKPYMLYWNDKTGLITYGNAPEGTGGVTDHGALTGLADDDHTQYALLNGRNGNVLKIDEITPFTPAFPVTLNGQLKIDDASTTTYLYFGTPVNGAYIRHTEGTGLQLIDENPLPISISSGLTSTFEFNQSAFQPDAFSPFASLGNDDRRFNRFYTTNITDNATNIKLRVPTGEVDTLLGMYKENVIKYPMALDAPDWDACIFDQDYTLGIIYPKTYTNKFVLGIDAPYVGLSSQGWLRLFAGTADSNNTRIYSINTVSLRSETTYGTALNLRSQDYNNGASIGLPLRIDVLPSVHINDVIPFAKIYRESSSFADDGIGTSLEFYTDDHAQNAQLTGNIKHILTDDDVGKQTSNFSFWIKDNGASLSNPFTIAASGSVFQYDRQLAFNGEVNNLVLKNSSLLNNNWKSIAFTSGTTDSVNAAIVGQYATAGGKAGGISLWFRDYWFHNTNFTKRFEFYSDLQNDETGFKIVNLMKERAASTIVGYDSNTGDVSDSDIGIDDIVLGDDLPESLALNDLSDVTLTNPDSWDILTLDDESNQWINVPRWPDLDEQDLSYTNSTGQLDISGGTGVTIPTFGVANTTDPGLVPPNNGLGAKYFLDANGDWSGIDLETYYFYPTSQVVTAGTVISGSYASLAAHDNVYWIIQDAAGVLGINVEAHFSGITQEPNKLMLHGRYDGANSVAIQVWDYIDNDWEEYTTVTAGKADGWIEYSMPDPSHHISGGAAIVRYYHSANGNPSDRLYVDYMTLVRTGGAGVNPEALYKADTVPDETGFGVATADDIRTAAVTNGSTKLTNGDQVYDFVTGQAYLTAEVDGSTTNEIEVVDEVYSAANFNGGTTSAVSQDDFYDNEHLSDADDDGLVDKADLSSAGFVKSDASGNLSVDAGSYVDVSGTPAATQFPIWSDANTLLPDTNMVLNGDELTFSMSGINTLLQVKNEGGTSGCSVRITDGASTISDFKWTSASGTPDVFKLRDIGGAKDVIVIEEASDDDVVRIDVDGDVGFNNTTPAYQVDVGGDVNYSGDLRKGGAIVPVGYTICAGTASISYTDGAIMYIGMGSYGTNTNYIRLFVPKAGTIKSIQAYTYVTGAPSNESWNLDYAINTGAFSSVAAIASTSNAKAWTNTALNTAVVQGDYILLRLTNPTWGTNPSGGSGFQAVIYIE